MSHAVQNDMLAVGVATQLDNVRNQTFRNNKDQKAIPGINTIQQPLHHANPAAKQPNSMKFKPRENL